jgi:hypothetical protein
MTWVVWRAQFSNWRVFLSEKVSSKEHDAENADSKALETLALCWAYRKRAFSVIGLSSSASVALQSLKSESRCHL